MKPKKATPEELAHLFGCTVAESPTLRTDTQLLDALEALPWAVEIKYMPGQPKRDSVPSLREQINRFLNTINP